MDKINFVNNSEPALNDTNLNLMQTNIENAINEVDNKIKADLVINQEIDTGKYYHGKKVYKKEILINAINQTTINEFNHGIENLNEIMSVKGTAYTTEGKQRPLPCLYTSNPETYLIEVQEISSDKIFLVTGTWWYNYLNKVYIILEYTKNE